MDNTRREIPETIRDIQYLIDCPEWQRLVTFLKGQIEARERAVRRPIITPQDQAEHNICVGELLTLHLFLKAPEIMLAGLRKDKIAS